MLRFVFLICGTLFVSINSAPSSVGELSFDELLTRLRFDNFALQVVNGTPNYSYQSDVFYASDPIVTLPDGGQLRGSMKSVSLLGKKYNSFKGIRYAQPPIGDLRFKSPVPYPSWDGVVDAKDHGGECVQPGYVIGTSGVEDCLFLNVYSPDLTPKEKYPVMFWIHGGSFTSGSGNQLVYSPEYLVDKDVIVVTINYRLGLFGFFSTGDKHSQGNYGFKDLILGLKWVQANIEAFGGDPNRVTIFGESSGGVMVHYLVLSNMAKGLFHAAISQSGNALNPWSLQDTPEEAAFKVAKKLNINATTTEELVEVLKTFSDLTAIAKATPTLIQMDIPRGNQPILFAPTIEPEGSPEERFLTEHPLKILKSGKFNHVPYILGNTDTESLYAVREQILNKDLFDIYNNNPNYLLPYEWHITPNTPAANDIIKNIKDMYFKGGNITDILDYIRYSSDRVFDYATYKSIELHASHQVEPIFSYIFSFDGFLNYIKKLLLVTGYDGAMHADDIGYFWKIAGVPPPVSPSSNTAITQKRLLQMWTDFAKTYNPTPEVNDLITVNWPSVHPDYEEFEYLDIGTDLEVKVGMMRERMHMWRDLDEKYGYKP